MEMIAFITAPASFLSFVLIFVMRRLYRSKGKEAFRHLSNIFILLFTVSVIFFISIISEITR